MGDPKTTTTFDSVLRALARAPSVRPLDLDLVGRTLGRYSVERRLGQGGMGVVYEAFDAVLGRKVALKVLRASERASGATRARLHEEARRLAALQHPHIATVYDAGEHDGIVFLALERAGGRSLRERLGAEPRLSLGPATSILRAVASALACAHEAGIVHRDLKPENVVVGDGGTVKIIDFGIATITRSGDGAKEGLTASTAPNLGRGAGPAGTRKYMAPEQAAGSPASARADVFAFGVMAREVLDASVARARERGTRAALRRLAARCTALDPDARPRDGAALVEALDAITAPGRSPSPGRLAAIGAAAALAVAALSRVVPAPPAEPAFAPAHGPERARAGSGAAQAYEAPALPGRLGAPRDRARPAGVGSPWLPRERAAGGGHASRYEPAEGGFATEGRIALAGTLARPDVAAASFSRPASDVPVTAFVDARGRLVVSVDGYAAPVVASAGNTLADMPLAPLAAQPRAQVLADGKGGAVIQVTLHVPGPGGDGGAATEVAGGAGAAPGGKEVGPGAMPTAGASRSRGATGKDNGPHLFDTVEQQSVPGVALPTHGSGFGGKSGPVRHFFCADYEIEGIRVVHGAGGAIEIVAGDEGTEIEIIAVIDATGEVVETGDGVTTCGARGDAFVALDG